MHAMHDELRGIDLNLLQVLGALLQERHVTRAARRLGLSQSATSHALRRLRDLYGDELLVRSAKGSLSLTPRALSLLPALERGLAELASSVRGEAAFEPGTARRSFAVGMADYSQSLLLAPLLAELGRDAPGIVLGVTASANVEELLSSGELDLALSPLPPGPGLEGKLVFRDRFICMVKRAGRLARQRLTLERYLSMRHVVVAPGGSPGSLVDDELTRRGLRREVVLRIPNFLVAPIVVVESDVIATAPARTSRHLAVHYPIRLIEPPLKLAEFAQYLIWHPRLTSDPAHAFLRGAVTRACPS